MAKRFYFDQYSSAESNARYTVEIHDRDFSGTAIELDGFFTLKYDESNINDFLRPIYPSYAEININVRESDTEFEAFIDKIPGEDEERYTVQIFRNLTQIWLGQIPTDLVDYPDQFYTYLVTISAVCGLSRLKNIKYDNNGTAYTGRNTILGHMLNCLAKLNYPALLGFAPLLKVSKLNWDEADLLKVNSGLENIDLAYDVFQEYDDFGIIDSMNCYDVLESLCRQFHYRLYMSGDCFLAQQINDLNAAFVYKYAVNGTLLSSTNVDFRKYFTIERTEGTFFNYPPIREITMLYNYKQGINRGNLLPPTYTIGTTASIGTITGGAGEILKINIAGAIRVIIASEEAWFVRYHLTLKCGTKYLTGTTSNIATAVPATWSDTAAVYIIDFGPYISVQTQALNVEILTPPIDPGGVSTFNLSLDDTYKNLTTPIVLPAGTYSITFNEIRCNLLFENDEAADGKIKFSALNTTDGSQAIKNRFNEVLPDTIIGDGPRIYSSGRLRVENSGVWTNSDSWAHESGGNHMNINKLRLQESIAMRRTVTKAFDYTLQVFAEIYHYPILNSAHRMLIVGYELDPDNDSVILNTIYYVTDRNNIVINSELDAPTGGSGGGSFGGGGGSDSHLRLHSMNNKADHAPVDEADYGKILRANPTTGEWELINPEQYWKRTRGVLEPSTAADKVKVLGTTGTAIEGEGGDVGVYGRSDKGVGVLGSSGAFGDPVAGHYTSFDVKGHMLMNGDASVWKLLNIHINQGGFGSNALNRPTLSAFVSGLQVLSFDANTMNELIFYVPMPFDYKEESEIFARVHFVPMGSAGSASAIRWGLEYSWQNIAGAAAGTSTKIYSASKYPNENFVGFKHYTTDFASISGTGKLRGSYLICRIFRDAANVLDTFGNGAGLIGLIIRYQANELGSNDII